MLRQWKIPKQSNLSRRSTNSWGESLRISWTLRKTKELTQFVCTCQRTAVSRPSRKCWRARKVPSLLQKIMSQPIGMKKLRGEFRSIFRNSSRWVKLGSMMRWRRTFSRELLNSVGSVISPRPIAMIWSKSGLLMSQWLGSWNATIAVKIGEIELSFCRQVSFIWLKNH